MQPPFFPHAISTQSLHQWVLILRTFQVCPSETYLQLPRREEWGRNNQKMAGLEKLIRESVQNATGAFHFRVCDSCGSWHVTYRKNNLYNYNYCSISCRQRIDRHLKKQAKTPVALKAEKLLGRIKIPLKPKLAVDTLEFEPYIKDYFLRFHLVDVICAVLNIPYWRYYEIFDPQTEAGFGLSLGIPEQIFQRIRENLSWNGLRKDIPNYSEGNVLNSIGSNSIGSNSIGGTIKR